MTKADPTPPALAVVPLLVVGLLLLVVRQAESFVPYPAPIDRLFKTGGTENGRAMTDNEISHGAVGNCHDGIEKVVLVVGSCGLDRLLTVSDYPRPDAKVRTTAYNEVGGGNAANTASAMALLSTASFLQSSSTTTTKSSDGTSESGTFRIKLLTKVGNDSVGQAIIRELDNVGVDLSSPLFRVGKEGSTTSFTTIIVAQNNNTRTCIHTPGTCGELTLSDVDSVDLDEVFENVVHLHSDCRHTDVGYALAREAKKRGIQVSVDAEKDRNIASQNGLLECADLVFTNSHQLQDYLDKRTAVLEQTNGRAALPAQTVQCDAVGENDMGYVASLDGIVSSMYANAIKPSMFFNRWYKDQETKEVVITK